jgi:hypothetical protein
MSLERRNAPASALEIYEDLVVGAYPFETENVPNRKRGLGQALSKASAIFKRLPNDKWGLMKWYPGLKPPKEGAAPADEPRGAGSKADANPKAAASTAETANES